MATAYKIQCIADIRKNSKEGTIRNKKIEQITAVNNA
jgi:hypothetical protein